MCNPSLVQLEDTFANSSKNIPDEWVILILAFIEELKYLNSIQKFHDKEADLFFDTLWISPGRWFLKVKVFDDKITLDILDDIKLSFGFRNHSIGFICV